MRSHVDGTSDARLEHLRPEVVHVLGKAEVSYLVDSFVDEDVGWLQVSVDYFLPDELSEPVEDLLDDVDHLFFFELLPLHQLFEVSIFAELGDDVETIFRA